VKPTAPPILTEAQRDHAGDVVLLSLRDLRDPFDPGYVSVVSRAEATGSYLAGLPGVSADTIATLRRPAGAGATWVLSVEVKRRLRVRLEQVVFEAA
jgi:hypothetical protein